MGGLSPLIGLEGHDPAPPGPGEADPRDHLPRQEELVQERSSGFCSKPRSEPPVPGRKPGLSPEWRGTVGPGRTGRGRRSTAVGAGGARTPRGQPRTLRAPTRESLCARPVSRLEDPQRGRGRPAESLRASGRARGAGLSAGRVVARTWPRGRHSAEKTGTVSQQMGNKCTHSGR